ncbi:piggyBac transposable element-derived protein 2-like [Venturia canescens]|uniref:piggyBac transposable element-derived protein 2-like n=1 Tax=Venturia canescens TaxID=32260 RepID=UPI001C9BCCE3|nr:piggyBac transposable element-derived protein 2-like [Venturia canescens]
MPKRKRPLNVRRVRRINTVENVEKNDHEEITFIPNPEDSGESDCNDGNDSSSSIDRSDTSTDDEGDEDHHTIQPVQSYRKVSENYNVNQKNLEDGHEYRWVDGEAKYNDDLLNIVLPSEKDKKNILASSPTDLFEMFFSETLKKYIIDATTEHGYQLTRDRLDKFLGVIIFTTFNKRLSQRDYWSTNPLLKSDVVMSALSRQEFKRIKSHIKYHKLDDENGNDKIWRVRHIMDIFNENIKRFVFFCTALCVDEMMLKFYGQISFKQFIKSKPIRFGIKEWALCSSNGYLFHCEIYCGKNNNDDFLPNCAQGSRVVMRMLQKFLLDIPPRKVLQYHIYFDNLFCCPDLLVHLKKLNLRATGTVRKNRIKETNDIDAKAPRGTFKVKHDQNSGINFITVVDSKPVSILSTAAGITPVSDVTRYDKNAKEKKTISFPNAFKVYNSFMGGVDLQDQYCHKLIPIVRSKKWTYRKNLQLNVQECKEIVVRGVEYSKEDRLVIHQKGYQHVALENDGTEIDDDEILLDFAKLSITALDLILLPEHTTWQPLS